MAIGVSASLGTPTPLRKHAVSVHLPTWKDMVGLGNGDINTLDALQNGYPRSLLHLDVRNLAQRCKEKVYSPCQEESYLSLFPDPASAEACEAYITSGRIHGIQAVSPRLVRQLTITFDADPSSDHDSQRVVLAPLCAVAYPESAKVSAAAFWRLTGMGISSRLAEAYLPHADLIRCSQASGALCETSRGAGAPVYLKLRQRIASMLARAAIRTGSHEHVLPSDVFLFPSGMSAIYHVHHMLLQWRNAESVMLGFPYELTLKMLETYGPSCKFFRATSTEDMDALEQYLSRKASDCTPDAYVQAIWCECPSNPLLWTPDLQRVRRLADQYDLAVVVDDTIGTSANVDVLDVADIVVTSLTKSFNGYANVLAGRYDAIIKDCCRWRFLFDIPSSATLNPNSRYHQDFKKLLAASYVNTLYMDDAIQLEINSRTFLERVAITNETAEYLVDHLRPLVSHCTDDRRVTNMTVQSRGQPISAIYFPKGSPSMSNYTRQMRRTTAEFNPGYGCLFTIEFDSVDVAARFFDNLDLHKGPSLGADVTLALPYVQMVLQREKEWAANHGLRETIVRISVGLENKDDLLKRLRRALSVACAPGPDLIMASTL